MLSIALKPRTMLSKQSSAEIEDRQTKECTKLIYLNKFIPILVSPIFIVTFLAILNIIFMRRWIAVLTVAILLIASSPILGAKSRAYLEKDYSYVPVSEVEKVDAVVVLSGMIMTLQDDNGKIFYELNGSIDRFEAGLAFMKVGKAENIIFTRGHLPWSKGLPEGELLREFAIDRGISPKQILLTGNAQNTDQEAQAVKDLLRENKKIALVTSAFHMPRALKVFEARGLSVTPYAVDFSGQTKRFTVMDFLPSAGALSQNSRFLREMLGRLYYALKY